MVQPLTPPVASTSLSFDKPEPVAVVAEEQASSFLPPVTAEKKQEIAVISREFVGEVKALTPNSPEFSKKLGDISKIASDSIQRAGSGASRMLASSSTSIAGSKKTKDDAQIRVSKSLGDLRTTVESLTPNAAGLSGRSKILGFIPGGSKIDKYFQKYESSEVQLDSIVKALMTGQDELLKDNASLEVEKGKMWNAMIELNEYASLAVELDRVATEEMNSLRSQGQLEKAKAMESDVVFAIRQRHQDILTQLAVSIQGYLAMGLVQKNNVELVKGVERARTTTITALRTAVIVAKALANQELVLNQIDGVNATTNNMIASTSALLRQNTTRVHEQAASSGVSVETLTKAFDDVFATMDAIDSFKAQANASMEQTINSLEGQLHRTRPYLERAKAQEDNALSAAPDRRSLSS